MSNSGFSTPESDDSFKSVQENFDLNPTIEIDTQESTKSPEKRENLPSPDNEETGIDLDNIELERIFAEPFEEVTVSSETNAKLEQLAKQTENENQILPGDA